MGRSAQGQVTIFLAGDVMTGRGVDQILPHPGSPALREPYVERATTYVELAERVYGPVPAPVEPAYIWGEGLAVLERLAPAASLVNLETSITAHGGFWPGKAVHYRMHPDNVACLRAAPIDLCSLANNHVLDFGRSGLADTLQALRGAGIAAVGAGEDGDAAARPVRLGLGGGAGLLVAACGSTSSGIPRAWAASPSRSGVHLVDEGSPRAAAELASRLRRVGRPGDLVVVSIHWGSNWGYEVTPAQVAFAHALVDGGVDVVHGHSSHHLRPVEVYRERLILYGCGDLVTDYEGIQGHEAWRGDLGAMVFPTLAARDGRLAGLRLVPTQMRRLRLTRAARPDGRWLMDTLNRISRRFGTRFAAEADGSLVLQ